MPVLAVAAELGPVARLAVPVAELDAQRSLGFRRDRESVPGTRIDRHDLRRYRYHVMVAPEPLHVVEACAFQTIRSEEHTSELQSLMRISYAVFCLKNKTTINKHTEQ